MNSNPLHGGTRPTPGEPSPNSAGRYDAAPRLVALTHLPSPQIVNCALTFLERTPIDFEKAQRQHLAYRRALADCGASVQVLDANLSMPDSVFIEDTAVVFDEIAILASMGAESRRGEPAGIEPELLKHRDVRRISLPATLDGGDIVVTGRQVLAGLSSRTNELGVAALGSALREFGYSVRPVRVHGALHLKSACTALPDGRLLVNAGWVARDDLGGFHLVDIPPEEQFAADVAALNSIVLASSAFPRTIALIESLGFEVRAVDLSEFAKAEGGVTCLSLIFTEHLHS